MPEPIDRHERVRQGSDYTFLDRIVLNSSGTLLDPADVTSWSLRVFEKNDRRNGKRIVDAASPAGYLNAALATTDGWIKDTTGWNFKYRLAYTSFKAEPRSYRFEFTFVTTAHGSVRTVWIVEYKPMGSV